MRLILSTLCLYEGAVLFAIPDLGRRDLLFGVRIPAGFREAAPGHNAVHTFRIVMAAAVLAGLCAILFSPAPLLRAAVPGAHIGIFLVFVLSFFWQRRTLAPFAVSAPLTGSGEVELTDTPDRLPLFTYLAAGPYLMLASAAAWLYLNYSRIPVRFPVHFGLDGSPNRWAERTIGGVYGSLFLGAAMGTWLLVMGLAGWFGSRRRSSRSVMLGSMIAAQYLMACVFSLVSIKVLIPVPIWLLALGPLVIVIPTIIVVNNKMSKPSDPMEATPDECWGMFGYYNPNDPALVVEKREGVGWTFNFANRGSWVLMGALPVMFALFAWFKAM